MFGSLVWDTVGVWVWDRMASHPTKSIPVGRVGYERDSTVATRLEQRGEPRITGEQLDSDGVEIDPAIYSSIPAQVGI